VPERLSHVQLQYIEPITLPNYLPNYLPNLITYLQMFSAKFQRGVDSRESGSFADMYLQPRLSLVSSFSADTYLFKPPVEHCNNY
jgi:hypothetical protein